MFFFVENENKKREIKKGMKAKVRRMKEKKKMIWEGRNKRASNVMFRLSKSLFFLNFISIIFGPVF